MERNAESLGELGSLWKIGRFRLLRRGNEKGTTNGEREGRNIGGGVVRVKEREKNEEFLSAFRRAIYVDRRLRGQPAMVRIIHSPSNDQIE